MTKAYPFFTIECPRQVGGTSRAASIITNTICEIGGLNQKEFDELCVLETTHDQVCLLVKNEAEVKRIRTWKHLINNILWGHKRNRQISGYMFHSAHQSRIV